VWRSGVKDESTDDILDEALRKISTQRTAKVALMTDGWFGDVLGHCSVCEVFRQDL
jgi:hypothetical protein